MNIFLRASLLCWSLASAVWVPAAPVTNISAVLALSDAELAPKPLVTVRGVVTGVDVSYDMRFVQDATGGIYLYQPTPPVDLQPGDFVEVRGQAARALFSPMISKPQITVLGKTNLPPPQPISIGNLNTGQHVGDFVEVEAVVQRVRAAGDHFFLHLVSGENRCTISVQHQGPPPDLVDARLRVRGVAAASFNKQSQLTGFQVLVQRTNDLVVVSRPVPSSLDAPVVAAADLMRQGGRRVGKHRVHVRGVVSLHWPGQLTVVQDATGGILIEGGLPGTNQLGDEVDVAGFLARPLEGARLLNAEARRVRGGQEVHVLPGALTEAAAWSNQLVRIVAEVVAWPVPRDGEVSAVLAAGENHFTARLPAAGLPDLSEAFPPGAKVSVTGVLRATAREAAKAPVFSLLMRGPADWLLVRPAPPSPWRWVWISAAVVLLLFAVANGLILFFWRRHQRVLAAAEARQKSTELRFAEMERQLRAAHRERELIAQELHDNIIQSIYSVGLGLDEARRLAGQNPDLLPARLDLAVGSLNAVIRDVRAFLGGMEPRGLDGHELKAALKSVLVTSGVDQETRFSIRIDPLAADMLTTLQATEIFSIAKEAMTNAMRHADAPLTTVSLFADARGQARLEIVDNGRGFDLACLRADALGLRHMQQRAQALGGTWHMDTAPGRGTRIIVEIPARSLLTSAGTHDNQ